MSLYRQNALLDANPKPKWRQNDSLRAPIANLCEPMPKKFCTRGAHRLPSRSLAYFRASSLSDLERSRNLEHEKSLKNEPALSEMPLKLRFAEKKSTGIRASFCSK